MGLGIIVCGMNGSGKRTLGKALAEALGVPYLDNEQFYFSRSAETDPYVQTHTRAEVEVLIRERVRECGSIVLASVKGDYGEEILPYYHYAVLIDVPKEIRMQRIRSRSYGKFGERMLPGGDLHESEEAFFRLVAERPVDYAERWVHTLSCPVIRVDGTRPIAENVEKIRQIIEETEHGKA